MRAVILQLLQNFIISFQGLFFMIIGQALFMGYDRNLVKFYKKAVIYLLFPFFIGTWILLMLKIGFSFSLAFGIDLLKAFITNSVEERFWMAYTVFGICLVAPFISIMLHSLSEKEQRTLLGLLVGYFAFFSLAIWFQFGIGIASYPFLNWLAYGITGYLMNVIPWSERELSWIKRLGISAILVSSLEAAAFPGVNWCLNNFCLTRILICIMLYRMFGEIKIKGKSLGNNVNILAEGVYILALAVPMAMRVAEKIL